MINLSNQNLIPFLVPSDLNPFLVPSNLNPGLTEHSLSRVRRLKLLLLTDYNAIVDIIINIRTQVASPEQDKLTDPPSHGPPGQRRQGGGEHPEPLQLQ